MSRRSELTLLTLWTLFTLPMIGLGYGSDPDAWCVARAAENIWRTGEYVRSRSTGFPIFELIVTPLVHAGKWYLSNLLPFVFGLGLMLALFRLAKKGSLVHPNLVVLCLCFLPVVIKNSSSTMDYVPAVALLVWAYTALLEKRWLATGVLIGLACGFRPTSGLFVIPVCTYAYLESWERRRIISLAMLAAITGVVAYAPALLKYGLPNSYTYTQSQIGLLYGALIGGYNFLRLLGIFPSLLVYPGLAWLLWKGRDRILSSRSFYGFHLVNLLIWPALFTLMPDEPEYLLPMLPSLVLLLDRLASRRVFAGITILFLSYHLTQLDILGGESGARRIELAIRPGWTIEDVRDRLFKLSTRKAATELQVSTPTLLMTGEPWIASANEGWSFDPTHKIYKQKVGNLYVSGQILDENRLRALRAEGFRLVVWNGDKAEYVITRNAYWRNYVEVIDDLDDFFGQPIAGKILSER